MEDGFEFPRGRLLPVPGTHGPAEVTDDDVRSISRALLLLITTTEKLTSLAAADPPPPGSTAYSLFHGSEVGYAMDGFLTMQYANLSAMDHARGFVALVRTPTVRSTALATLARGTLESLARTWHLLASRSDRDFLHRVISLLRADLRYSELLKEAIHTRDGDAVDPAAKRAFYLEELKRLGLPTPAKVELAQMVASMLDAEMQNGEGRTRYSSLSAIAHAHRLAINTFVTTDSTGDVFGLAAPRPVVTEMVGLLVAATYGTMSEFVSFYGDQTRHIELLEASMERAIRSLAPVLDQIWRAP